MKLPPPRQRAQVDGYATRTNRTDSRIEKHREYMTSVEVTVEPGPASVAASRGLKHWFSTREAGITVEAAATVTLSCQQHTDALVHAAEEAGKLAEQFVKAGCADMDLYIERFMRETEDAAH